MKSIESNKNFNELVQGDKPFVLDFYADWCGPCQVLLPRVEKLAKEFEGEVEIRKVNVDTQKDLAAKFQVRSIPALFFMHGNVIHERVNGATSEGQLRSKIQKLTKKAAKTA